MHGAVVDLGSNKLLVTMGAPKLLQSGKHLPEYLHPGYLFLSKIQHELVDVPMLVALMLGNHPSIEVDEEVGFGALHPLSLIAGVQGTAVDAPVQHVVLLLEKVLKLLHEDFACQLVFLVLKLVELIQRDFACKPLD